MAFTQSDVFENTVYGTVMVLMLENINLFNQNSEGCIVLQQNSKIQGDFAQNMLLKLSDTGIVLPRNPYGNATVADKRFERVLENRIKFGLTTPVIKYNKTEFNWVKQNPELAGVTIGKTLAEGMQKQMIDYAVGTAVTNVRMNNALLYPSANKTLNHNDFVQASGIFGDQMGNVKCFVIHSTMFLRLYDTTFKNAERLFAIGNTMMYRTVLNQLFVVTDNSNLLYTDVADNKAKAITLGLTESAVVLENEDNFNSELVSSVGNENITYSFQANWDSAISVKNRRFKTQNLNGGAVDKGILTQASNWEQINTNVKAELGVGIVTEI